MKKVLIIVLFLSMVLSSCYEDYLKDFEYDSIYFSYQTDIRTFVVGEGMKIQIGAELGGVRENPTDRNVTFAIDNSLITPAILKTMKGGLAYMQAALVSVTTLLPVPANYYTLSSNNTIVIKSGQHGGAITLKPDSAAFLADSKTLQPNYAIGLKITSADADTIFETKRYTVIGLKYENMLFGNYWHGGVTTVKNASGTVIQTIIYKTAIPVPENKIWKLTTVAPNVLVTNGYSDVTTSKGEMRLTLSGNNITISSNTGATNVVMPDQTSSYNGAKLLQNRKIVLSYKYVNSAGNTCYAQDTLTFRNRIRDGVNEWQDDNPSHYN